jgi:molybdenum cofactor cytidylyltransferase
MTMQLAQALRITRSTRAAIVGAGGKTTALFSLARQLKPPVFLTATTHLAKHQVNFADHHIEASAPSDVPDGVREELAGVILFTGGEADSKRVSGVTPPVLARLHQVADARNVPLLMEADGARGLPLKGTDHHEPPIPNLVNMVIVLAGLSGLGKPLTGDWVHRPERFAKLSGLEVGEPVSPTALERVLRSPRGGLKNVPPGSKRVVLLNQMDALEACPEADLPIARLLEDYHAVGVTALAEGQVSAVHERVGAVVLAAGEAQRYGKIKQLLPWQGEPLVRGVVSRALKAGFQPVVVVVGAEGEKVAQAVAQAPVEVVWNQDWEAGQSTSVKKGLRTLPPFTGGALFLLADQPQIPLDLMRQLRKKHAETHAPLIAPWVEGRIVNPVLFDRITFSDFKEITGDQGGRALFERYEPVLVPWADPFVALDIDTPEDYQSFLDHDSRSSGSKAENGEEF